MSTWDEQIFTVDANTDFLDELVDLDFEDVFEAVRDAVLLAAKQDPSEEELLNGQAAATIAAIWACLLYTSPSPRDRQKSRMPSSA